MYLPLTIYICSQRADQMSGGVGRGELVQPPGHRVSDHDRRDFHAPILKTQAPLLLVPVRNCLNGTNNTSKP
jgi:hypothetical protein